MVFWVKLWRCRRKLTVLAGNKIVLLTLCIILIFLFALCFHLKVDLGNDSFVEKSKCPACFGTNLCKAFGENEVKLNFWSRWYNAKNVYHGYLWGQRIVLKKLASEWELDQLDSLLCNLVVREDNIEISDHVSTTDCDVGKTLRDVVAKQIQRNHNAVPFLEKLLETGKLFLAKRGIVTDVIRCPSKRFLSTILNSSLSPIISNSIASISHLTTSLLINPEPVLIKNFRPMSDAFPNLIGACGRVIVEEYSGPTMTEFKSSPLFLRLKIAKELLVLADRMTFNTIGGFKYYMTDVSFDNFAVEEKGRDLKIMLIDVESILVTDPQSLVGASPTSPTYINPFGDQTGHLKFSTSDLCFHSLADHNYYAVCECLLSDVPCSPGFKQGLLWGITQEMEEKWQLQTLIRSCQMGTEDRIHVAHKLIEQIDDLLNWLRATRQEDAYS